MAVKKYKVVSGKIHTELKDKDGKAYTARLAPGDVFEIDEKAVANLLDQVEEIKDAPKPAAPAAPPAAPPADPPEPFELQKIKEAPVGKPGFNVIDTATKEAVNPEPLFKADAEKLLEEKLGEQTNA